MGSSEINKIDALMSDGKWRSSVKILREMRRLWGSRGIAFSDVADWMCTRGKEERLEWLDRWNHHKKYSYMRLIPAQEPSNLADKPE
jgi:hypothetical protein